MWTIIGAIATVVCAVFAILTYVYDIKKDKKQNEQPPRPKV